jgi:hypothetical protein
MNENFISGSKAQFKNKNCIERKVPLDTRCLQLNFHAFKRGLLLPAHFCLLPPLLPTRLVSYRCAR